MENTLENKAKFFARYFGQRVLKNKQGDGNRLGINTCQNPSQAILECEYLELTPLSAITDDHAIELSKRFDTFKGDTPPQIKAYKDNAEFMVNTSIDCSDYARSVGYAIRSNGLSVEEQIKRGWTKLREDV